MRTRTILKALLALGLLFAQRSPVQLRLLLVSAETDRATVVP